MEADIEMAFVRLLGDGSERRIVNCQEVQRVVFDMTRERAEEEEEEEAERVGPLDAAGQEKGGHNGGGDEAEDEGGRVRLPCHAGKGPAIATTMRSEMGKASDTTRGGYGMQEVKAREMVRRVARRGVAFGFEIEEGRRRRVEAVQSRRTVESSFAKGEWGVRWMAR